GNHPAACARSRGPPGGGGRRDGRGAAGRRPEEAAVRRRVGGLGADTARARRRRAVRRDHQADHARPAEVPAGHRHCPRRTIAGPMTAGPDKAGPDKAGPIKAGTVASLVEELRAVGVPVSVGEHLDATRAVAHLPLRSRAVLHAALRCTLVKEAGQLATFDLLFDLWAAGGQEAGEAPLAGLPDAIQTGDMFLQPLLADEYVRRFAGVEPGRAVAGVRYMLAVTQAANLDGIRDDLLAVGTHEDGPHGDDLLSDGLAGGAGAGGGGAGGVGGSGVHGGPGV